MDSYALPKDVMDKFPLYWQLQRSNHHVYKNCSTSNLKVSAEWSLKCLWSNNNSSPEYLEICRNSNDRDVIVSGTLTLLNYEEISLIERKFSQLIEKGYDTTLIDLDQHKWKRSGRNAFYSQPLSYSMKISFTTSAGSAHTKKSKEVNFDSLLVMSSDFERLLDPKVTYFSDVNLRCGTVSFSVHKNILSVRSPVFAAMFTSEMRENRENKVSITDINAGVLKSMLIYIYTGKTKSLSVQTASELLFAGDKYQLQDLRKVCTDYLKSCVSVENVLKTLVLGYLHDEDLKNFAVDFICSSSVEFEAIEKTTEWKNLIEKIPSLAMYVLTLLVKSKDEKLKRRN